MSNKNVILKLAVGYVCLVSIGLAHAASEDSSAPVVHMGGVDAYPGFSLVEKNDSNPFRTHITEKHNITVASPSVMLKAQNGGNSYSLGYNADIGRFSNSSADNYVDHNFAGFASLALFERATLTIKPEYKKGHDDRGSAPTVSLRNDWHSTGISGSFKYGAAESQGSFVLDAGHKDLLYTNNRVVAIGNPVATTDYDRTTKDLGGTFYYRVMPKTSLLFNVAGTRINYKTKTTLNGNELRYMAGVKWDATAQTQGEFKVGQQQKRFDSGRQTYKGGGWDGNINWSPVQVVRVNFLASRKTDESTWGNFILSGNTSLDFAYDLNERATLHANGAKLTEDFKGSADNRSDNTNTYGLKADYKLLKWLIGGVEYSKARRTSSSNPLTNDYDRRMFGVNLHSEL